MCSEGKGKLFSLLDELRNCSLCCTAVLFAPSHSHESSSACTGSHSYPPQRPQATGTGTAQNWRGALMVSKNPQAQRFLKPELKSFLLLSTRSISWMGDWNPLFFLNNPCQLFSVWIIKFDRIEINNETADVKEKSASPAYMFSG